MSGPAGWREKLAWTAEPTPALALDEAKTALLIIDMQKCSTPDSDRGRHMRNHAPEIADAFFAYVRDVVVPNQVRLLEFWRKHGLRVVYTTTGSFLANGTDMSPRRQRRDAARLAAMGMTEHMHPHAADYQIMNAVRPEPGEIVIPKNSAGAFNSSPIDQILRNMGITGLVIGGLITEACVESTAREAADRGYDCILLDDGCASDLSRDIHEATLFNFARTFGEVRSTQDVLDHFEAKLSPQPVSRLAARSSWQASRPL